VDYDRNNSKYWSFHLDRSSSLGWGEDVFFEVLVSLCNISKNVLEIGVGKWRMVDLLTNRKVKAKFVGIDIVNFRELRNRSSIIGDARILPFRDNSFDLVYSLGVVEHFPQTNVSISEHSRVTKNGGHVLITVPHLSICTPLRYLTYYLRDSKYGSFDTIRGKNLLLSTMIHAFSRHGLTIVDYGFYGIYGLGKILSKTQLLKTISSNPIIGSYLYIIGQKICSDV